MKAFCLWAGFMSFLILIATDGKSKWGWSFNWPLLIWMSANYLVAIYLVTRDLWREIRKRRS